MKTQEYGGGFEDPYNPSGGNGGGGSRIGRPRSAKGWLALAALMALVIGVPAAIAFSSLTATSNGTITTTATPANLAITSAGVTNGGSCGAPFNGGLSVTCSGWTIGQGGTSVMTVNVSNSGGTAATIVTATSGVSPTGLGSPFDATCAVTGPTSVAAGGTAQYTVTYTAGQTTSSTASCTLTIS